MTTIKQALLSAGFKATEPPKKTKQPTFGPAKPDPKMLAKIAERQSRLAIFTQDLAREYRASQRNPSVSGTMARFARLVQAAGSDSHKKYRVTPERVRFGWEGRRNGQQFPDEKE